MAISPRTRFLLYSRPLFRTCEILCNHAARIIDSNGCLAKAGDKISLLNNQRAKYQRILNRIGNTHGHICADCKGECCGGMRDRDAFLDRVLQDPETSRRSARNKRPSADYIQAGCDLKSHGHCAELTSTGCKIPYENRPIQCTAYFCTPCINVLSEEQCQLGIKALSALMSVQIKSVKLAFKERLKR